MFNYCKFCMTLWKRTPPTVGNFGSLTPLPLRNSIDHPRGEYGFFSGMI